LSTFERNVDTKMDQMYDLLLVMYEKQWEESLNLWRFNTWNLNRMAICWGTQAIN
jgi:hypothetical protein